MFIYSTNQSLIHPIYQLKINPSLTPSVGPNLILTRQQEGPLSAWNEQLRDNQSYGNRCAVWW